jgi:hypothetical protein
VLPLDRHERNSLRHLSPPDGMICE